MNVKLIRMSSGEDILADIRETTDDVIVIENPIVAVPAGNGQIGFAPWSPLLSGTKKEIEVGRNFVVYIAEAQDEVVEQYNKMYSPLATPNKKLIL